ncbi:uncharacterized protein THITE_2116326 [Thermothielavioides terrestris NRRL 8126]|uniref:Uncharacterized protein n=1 Tax=Thermothielavioides terrestris (strain ATCC 38088 / NRRL 8126) TaxID=578455 RepID=G2R5F7_THETT|nr:uncharacterized protein THITE_2116326 [Thermothielavioides terrestris NRRL 8126]AEO67448.1 hypothetical protein THITE_2116326 [Thermothielavioides terrestris NRRL 8126]
MPQFCHPCLRSFNSPVVESPDRGLEGKVHGRSAGTSTPAAVPGSLSPATPPNQRICPVR